MTVFCSRSVSAAAQQRSPAFLRREKGLVLCVLVSGARALALGKIYRRQGVGSLVLVAWVARARFLLHELERGHSRTTGCSVIIMDKFFRRKMLDLYGREERRGRGVSAGCRDGYGRRLCHERAQGCWKSAQVWLPQRFSGESPSRVLQERALLVEESGKAGAIEKTSYGRVVGGWCVRQHECGPYSRCGIVVSVAQVGLSEARRACLGGAQAKYTSALRSNLLPPNRRLLNSRVSLPPFPYYCYLTNQSPAACLLVHSFGPPESLFSHRQLSQFIIYQSPGTLCVCL